MSGHQSTLLGFFKRKSEGEIRALTSASESDCNVVAADNKKPCLSENSTSTTSFSYNCVTNSSEYNFEDNSPLVQSSEPSVSSSAAYGHVNDISNFVSRRLTDNEKLELLNNVWLPPKNYSFPLLDKFKEKKLKLRFQYQWLYQFDWLVYSEKDRGAYCKYCVAFAETGGVGNQPLGHLVKVKFDNWKKAKEWFKVHGECKYHVNSVSQALDFLKFMSDRSRSVINIIDKDRKMQVQKNRNNLQPIIEAIILCGRQEIALRGHRDFGKIVLENTDAAENQGNFRAILKYRAAGDDNLRSVLEGPGERNKYISPTIQNEVIDICNLILLKKVVSEINCAKCFTVLADETTDISTSEI